MEKIPPTLNYWKKQDTVPCDEQVIRQELNSKISELFDEPT